MAWINRTSLIRLNNLYNQNIDNCGNCLISIVLTNIVPKKITKFLFDLVESIENINYEILVSIDQNTNKMNSELLELSEKLPIIILKSTKKTSRVSATNQASKQAKGKYIVCLDSSIIPTLGWLHDLVEVVESYNDCGLVGPQLMYTQTNSMWKIFQSNKKSTTYYLGKEIIAGTKALTLLNSIQKERYVKVNKSRNLIRLPSHHCVLISKTSFSDINGLDKRLNYSDAVIELGLRLINKGFKNYTCVSSLVKCNQNIFKSNENNINSVKFIGKRHHQIIKQYWKEKIFSNEVLGFQSIMCVALAVTDHGEGVTAGDYYTAQELALSLEKFGWKVIFLSRFKDEWYKIPNQVDVLINLLDEYNLREIPKREKRIIKVAWARNWFDKWCASACFNDYDIVFASSENSCQYINEHSHKEALLLPLATNPDRFETIPVCNHSEKYQSDLCFTGSYWQHPREIMQALSQKVLDKYTFHVYGANWEHFDRFKKHNKGFIDYQKISCVYHYTKIVIDDANHVTKPYGSVNSRVFDAIMSGALVITNGKKGSDELFNSTLPFYEYPVQLEEQIEYYLNNSEARKKRVNELKSHVIKHHTYDHRAETIKKSLISYLLKTSIAIKIPAPSWEKSQNWGDYHMATRLKKEFEKIGYRVLLQVLPEWDNEEGYLCDVVIVLRGLSKYKIKPHQLNLMWNISHPDKVTLNEYEEYDKVFIASKLWAEKIANKISKPVECMLQCTDIERFSQPTKSEMNEYKSQLLFVGNSRLIYRKILKDLIPTEYQLSVYGNDWQDIIPNKFIKGEHINNTKLNLHYGSANILLNDHWDDMRDKGFISNRIFDGLACGAFIITDNVKELGELSKYVVVYKNKKDLKMHIEHYLKQPELRTKNSSESMKYIKKNHSFLHRSNQFSISIEKLIH